ncbi:hypothetical protein GCM10010519_31530 [Streptomyces lactacystinicus]
MLIRATAASIPRTRGSRQAYPKPARRARALLSGSPSGASGTGASPASAPRRTTRARVPRATAADAAVAAIPPSVAVKPTAAMHPAATAGPTRSPADSAPCTSPLTRASFSVGTAPGPPGFVSNTPRRLDGSVLARRETAISTCRP